MGEGLNFIKNDGTLNETAVQLPHPYLNKKKVADAVQRCLKIKGYNICDKAYRQSSCFYAIAKNR